MSHNGDPRRGLPPVQALGDLSWARIERSVWAELDAAEAPAPMKATAKSGAAIAWLGAGAAIAAAAAAVLVVANAGGSERAPTSSSSKPLASAPQWVVTDDGATAMTFGDARITVAPHSAVVMTGDPDQGVLVLIDRGAADFEVAPHAGRTKFLVQAGEVSVRVAGTAFRVERVGDRAVVWVTHGSVEVVAPGEVARVNEGERWPAEVAVTAPTPAPAPVIPIVPSPTPAAPRHARHVAPTPVPVPTPAPVVDAVPDPAPDSAPVRVEPPTPAPDDAQRFAAASAMEARDPDGALAAYRLLAEGQGVWAANALYAQARLLYDRHHDDDARAALSAYLDRFPRGANAADARTLLDRLTGALR